MAYRHPALEALVARRVDPSSGLEVLLDELRREGFAGTVEQGIMLALTYRSIPEAWPLDLDPRLTLTRSSAGRVLGVTDKRVDQLCQRGRLVRRHRADGTVVIDPDSVHAYLRDLRDPRAVVNGGDTRPTSERVAS